MPREVIPLDDLKVFTGQFFAQRIIFLDDAKYIRCTFLQCAFIVKDRRPERFERNSLTSCLWIFEGHMAETLRFLRWLPSVDGGSEVVEDTFRRIMTSQKLPDFADAVKHVRS